MSRSKNLAEEDEFCEKKKVGLPAYHLFVARSNGERSARTRERERERG